VLWSLPWETTSGGFFVFGSADRRGSGLMERNMKMMKKRLKREAHGACLGSVAQR
jgi:hypothetical protein